MGMQPKRRTRVIERKEPPCAESSCSSAGLAAGFVLGSRAGREKYEEIRANAKKVWEHPTVQEAAGVAQAQANKLYTEGKDKLDQSKLGQKLHASSWHLGQLS